MKRVEAYRPIGPLNPDGKIIVLADSIDSFYKMGEAKPGQRQRALVFALFEVNEEGNDWKHSGLDSLLPEVYSDRYYPQEATHLVWQANQSLHTFARSLELGIKQSVKIADEVKAQRENYHNLTHGEILDVIFRRSSFKNFARRTRMHEE